MTIVHRFDVHRTCCTTFVKQLAGGDVEMQTRAEATELDLSAVLQALSDPLRRSIVERLAREGEVPCGGFGIAVTKSTRTCPFRVLRDAGLIELREEGNRKLNSLRRADVDSCF